MGGVDSEAILETGVSSKGLGEIYPLPGWPPASADDYEGVALRLELPEGFRVSAVRFRGPLPCEEAAAEADGDDHGLSGFPRLRI